MGGSALLQARRWSSFVYAALVLAFPAVSGSEARAQSLDSLFSAILSSPDDSALNKSFARQAEAQGDIRLAYAAIERVVTSSPGDTEAQAEYDRLRKKILPAVTRVTVEVGASYASNPAQLPGSASRSADATFDAGVSIADERTIAGIRWRTKASAYGQVQADLGDLNYGIAAAESGPVFFLTPEFWMHISSGGAYAWLDDQRLFTDTTVAVTFGGLYKGLTQSVTGRYTWRDGNFTGSKASDAQIIDLEGRFVVSPSLTTGDLLYILPRVQISKADGNAPDTVFVTNGADFSFNYVRDLFPGDYNDIGGRIAYYVPINRGWAFFGAGIGIYERWYDEKVSNVLDLTATGDRRDFYIEPTAHLIFPNLIAPSVDLRFDYRFEGNYSNDNTKDYENHVAGARIVGRF